MRANEITIGGVYACRVSGKLAPVRVDRSLGRGRWAATNTATGRAVRVSSARLRWEWGNVESRRRYNATQVAERPATAPAGPPPTIESITAFSLLRYAIGRAISCRCGGFLDARSAVLIETRDGGTVVACGRCADRIPPARLEELGARVLCDGRTVGGAVRMAEGMLR